ncbi:hypothetical protein PAV_109p00670 (plasmid) [Paenibacillus alvei DSM 29]|nr:hypothetical protein PAV_109p00670 [Paenibacillus alvei DSM 29]
MTLLIKELFRRNEKHPTSNITKYPVGTRVPQNQKAERIVQNALYSNLNKTKRSI